MLPGVDTVPAILSLVPALVVPLILVLFYLDGMIVGKIAPPAALFVAYVAVASPTGGFLLVLSAGSVAASTLGQWTLYRGFNDERPQLLRLGGRVPYIDRLPELTRSKVGEERMEFVTRSFDRFGGVGLCLTNAVPGIRSLMAVPAGLSRYPVRRFVLFAATGNALYVLLLVAVAYGLSASLRGLLGA